MITLFKRQQFYNVLTKNKMETLKNKIKDLAASQIDYKNQRKTVHIVGERTMTAAQARGEHSVNRWLLRNLYMAYGIMRGREPQVIDINFGDLNMTYVDKLIAEYTPVEPAQETAA